MLYPRFLHIVYAAHSLPYFVLVFEDRKGAPNDDMQFTSGERSVRRFYRHRTILSVYVYEHQMPSYFGTRFGVQTAYHADQFGFVPRRGDTNLAYAI